MTSPEIKIEDTPVPRSRAELSRTSRGHYSWRVSVVAADDTPAALIAALDLLMEVDAELDDRYGSKVAT